MKKLSLILLPACLTVSTLLQAQTTGFRTVGAWEATAKRLGVGVSIDKKKVFTNGGYLVTLTFNNFRIVKPPAGKDAKLLAGFKEVKGVTSGGGESVTRATGSVKVEGVNLINGNDSLVLTTFQDAKNYLTWTIKNGSVKKALFTDGKCVIRKDAF